MLKPKLLTTLKGYSWKLLRADLNAGIIVGFVALPLAIAFGIASGVSPDKGLVTAVVAGFIISALGGSRVQIGGPTGAFVVIVYNIIQKHGADGLMVATFLGGIILVILGVARFGMIIKFIPYPVTIGFTSGIALIIFSSQIKDFLGLPVATVPVDFFEKWKMYTDYIGSTNVYAVGIASLTIGIILLSQKISRKIPSSLAALLITTAIVTWFNLPVETIGKRFGEIPHTLPAPQWPPFNLKTIGELLPPAFSIAILAGIESLLSAVVADGMIGGRHRSNMELVAQGIANIASPLFGGIPATGAIARTATNVQNGAKTPVAGMIHAVTLLFIMLVFAKWAGLIPMAALAGILIIVAVRMSEFHSFKMILKAPRSDAIVLLTTFTLTVVLDLTVAIQIGMVLASFLLIYRLSQTVNIRSITGEFTDEEERDDPNAISKREVPKDVEVFEISGPFFFGVVSTFIETMSDVERKPKIRILRMRHVSSLDATALNALRQVALQSRHNSVTLILSGVNPQPMTVLRNAGFPNLVGQENILPNIDAALNRARTLLGLPPADRKIIPPAENLLN